MKKRFVLIPLFMLFAPVLFGAGLDDIKGYKNIEFGTNSEYVRSLFETNRVSTADEVGGVFFRRICFHKNCMADIYLDDIRNVIIFVYFFRDRVYRIDLANFTGKNVHVSDVYRPITGTQLQVIRNALHTKYGEPKRAQQLYYEYQGVSAYEDLYWWYEKGKDVSVSFLIRPDQGERSENCFAYRVSYYYEPLLDELRRYRHVENNIAEIIGL